MKSNEYNETYKEKIKNAKPGDIIEVPIDYEFSANGNELAYLVLEWWGEHKDDKCIDALDRDFDVKLHFIEPKFVTRAKEIING